MAYRGKSLFPKIVAKSVPMRSAAELQKYRNRKRRFLAEGGGHVPLTLIVDESGTVITDDDGVAYAANIEQEAA